MSYLQRVTIHKFHCITTCSKLSLIISVFLCGVVIVAADSDLLGVCWLAVINVHVFLCR
jgi:hypothetical protein